MSKQKTGRVIHPVLPWVDAQSVDTVISLLKEMKRRKSVSDWRVNFRHVRAANVYVGRRFRIEDRLSSTREELVVVVYKRFKDGTIGEAQVPIITTAEGLVRKDLETAAALCKHTRKKAYDLPQPDEVTFPQGYDHTMFSLFDSGDGMRIPLSIHKQMRSILSGKEAKTNCYEILTETSATRVLNSNGVDVSFMQTSVYIEATFTAAVEGGEQEHHWWTHVASPDQVDLRVVLKRQAEIAVDAARAVPSPGFEGDVLLSGRSLLDFFAPEEGVNPLVLHTFARLKMMRLSQLERNQPLGEFSGEPFTISSNPHLPLGTLSVPVDEEGTPLRPFDLIRTGVFVNHVATSRYAQHMDLPRTGMVSNIHVSEGATREEHLRGSNYVEIVSFSWFNPDPFSGEFSAEIRLGYLWENGKKRPFKGGYFTGNVFRNMLSARFSKETIQEAHYYGPRAILFRDAVVTKRA